MRVAGQGRVVGLSYHARVGCSHVECTRDAPSRGGGDAKREGGTRPSKCTTAGIFTLFVTNSNDLAVGLPLFTALYPSSQQKGGDIVSYLYVDGSHMSGR